MAQELFELLQNDHDKIRGILQDLDESKDEKSRERRLRLLRLKVLPHLAAEDEELYPALMQHEDAREEALEAIEEHHFIRLVLGELVELPVSEANWPARLKVLTDLLEHHIEEEESEYFDAMEETFDDQRMSELHIALEDAKRQSLSMIS